MGFFEQLEIEQKLELIENEKTIELAEIERIRVSLCFFHVVDYDIYAKSLLICSCCRLPKLGIT